MPGNVFGLNDGTWQMRWSAFWSWPHDLVEKGGTRMIGTHQLARVAAVWTLSVAVLLAGVRLAVIPADAQDPDNKCLTSDVLQGLMPGDISSTTQSEFDYYSWQTFLALNHTSSGVPVWAKTSTQDGWSSTADLLNQLSSTTTTTATWDATASTVTATTTTVSTPPASGTLYYPELCQTNYPASGSTPYSNYRVLQQVHKVNDSLFEAESGGLSASPVVNSNGKFIRYEILISPATYNHIVEQGYYTAAGQINGVNMNCATGTAVSPTDHASGALNLKLAWMEDPTNGADNGKDATYYTQRFLVYTPADLISDKTATCKLAYHRLVGVHIARKAMSQQGWVWATFEQKNNTPDCTAHMPTNNPNQSCPAPDDTTYNFLPALSTCAYNGACAMCNTTPAKNCAGTTSSGWCEDKGPKIPGGYSALCRQVSTQDLPVPSSEGNYGYASQSVNNQCHAELPDFSVWSNYELISTQWYSGTLDTSTCKNQVSTFNDPTKAPHGLIKDASDPTQDIRALIRPQVLGRWKDDSSRPGKHLDGKLRKVKLYGLPQQGHRIWPGYG